jgi:hypothetical protein
MCVVSLAHILVTGFFGCIFSLDRQATWVPGELIASH